MAIPLINEASFAAEVLQSELPVLLDFCTERSTACKQIEPEVEAVARDLEGKAKVFKVDIERSPVLARELRIQSVPTFMVVAQGRVVDAKAGGLRRAQLRAMLDPFLPRAEGAITVAELDALVREGRIVPVDVREAPVYARAHLPDAVNLPEAEIEGRLAELHMLPGEPVLYCRSGDRSKELAGRLAEQGMPVAYLEGGLLGWEAEGKALVRPD
jgi:thioredoxin-like negative regulator of GroEL